MSNLDLAVTDVWISRHQAEPLDPGKLGRLWRAQDQLAAHRVGTCRKCEREPLRIDDECHPDFDKVVRTWSCRQCEYRVSADGIPISHWPEEMRTAWWSTALRRFEKSGELCCPDCGRSSVTTRAAGLRATIARSHLTFFCMTNGCTFEARTVWGGLLPTVVAGGEYAAFLGVLAWAFNRWLH